MSTHRFSSADDVSELEVNGRDGDRVQHLTLYAFDNSETVRRYPYLGEELKTLFYVEYPEDVERNRHGRDMVVVQYYKKGRLPAGSAVPFEYIERTKLKKVGRVLCLVGP